MKTILGLIVVGLVAYLIVRKFMTRRAISVAADAALFSKVQRLFSDQKIIQSISASSKHLQGTYQNQKFQLQTIIDTLGVRKLPSLWLMVTLPASLKVTAKFDMMMRPAGPTSFSNFDFLNYTIPTPLGFPEDAVLRSDANIGFVDFAIVTRHIGFFENPRAKEFLITPQGLRLVVQLAEADRAMYGVFREARFNHTIIDSKLVQTMMNTLLAVKAELEDGGIT